MIILDTNVISETQKKIPNPNVMAWLDAQDPTNLYLTAVTVGELIFGVFCLDRNERFDRLSSAITTIIEDDFRNRVLAYDAAAAMIYGMRVADVRRKGITIGQADGCIASIAIANDMAPIATRDLKPFKALGLDVVNPWQDDTPT